MKTKAILIPVFLCFFLTSCHKKIADIETDYFQICIDNEANVISFFDSQLQKEYLCESEESPLMSIRADGIFFHPSSASYNSEQQELLLNYPVKDIGAKIAVEVKSTHVTFELISIDHPDNIELILWGPYPTTINKIIGETVGVVRGDEFAIGLQALNPKTLGGYPWQENDCMPQIDIFENEDLSDMSEEGKRHVLYRVEAAKPTEFGSSLQAYCRNRNKERIISNWGHENYPAPEYDDGGIIGSKIAIFGCPVEQTLETIGNIEVAENLPHPMLDGQWTKTASAASSSYIILPFGEQDIQEAINITREAGFNYLYHPGPFKTWGHFELNDQFPNGIEGLKACVDMAEEQGVFVGLHTLSNFITTNDAYVTPIPDRRLAQAGLSTVGEDINLDQTEVTVESPNVFRQSDNNNLKTVRIGDELIQYTSVSDTTPWKLLACKRGAWGTSVAIHIKGDTIALLADHGYKVFLTDADLSKEVAFNIARLYNQTGLRQISFDGLEGNRSTAMGNYGEILFTNEWYHHLSDEIKQHYIADASRTSHYFWHMYTRMNWGEPWYAGFRESQTEYRLKNQKYFIRNMMPGMLGWFSMRNTTSLEDIEWMLARSAGFNAGFALVVSREVLNSNGLSKEILNQVKNWEFARLHHAFTSEQKDQMKDISKEFHLKPNGKNSWKLYPEHVSLKNTHPNKTRQPGEPTRSGFKFSNPYHEQPLAYTLKLVSDYYQDSVSDMYLELNVTQTIHIPVSLKAGQILKIYEDGRAIHFNERWNIINELEIPDLKITPGDHTIEFDCKFNAGEKAEVRLEFRCSGKPETITIKK